MREKRNVAVQMPVSNPEVRGRVGMQMLIEQLFNECLISARHTALGAAREIAVNKQMWCPELLEPTFAWRKTSKQP